MSFLFLSFFFFIPVIFNIDTIFLSSPFQSRFYSFFEYLETEISYHEFFSLFKFPPYFLFPSAIDRFIPSRFQRIFRFFKKYPEYQRYFTAFMDTPLNELPANKRFQAHCAGVITALNNVIDFLHDPGLMEASLIGLVERHKKRGQTKEEFQVREWKLENRENLIYI